MLTNFTIRNYKSFKDETTIDIHATQYRLLTSSNTHQGILKGSLFFGANSSGKTNLLKALKLLFDLLLTEEAIDLMNEQCVFSPHNDLFLEYIFKFDEDVIKYSLNCNTLASEIIEKVFCNDQCIAHRESKNASPRTHILKNLCTEDSQQIGAFNKLLKFLSNSVYINIYERQIVNPDHLPLEIDRYLNQYGVKKINQFFKDLNFNQQITYSNKEVLIQKDGLPHPMPFHLESVGMQNLLNMLPSLFHIIHHSGMLIIDEFSNGFHNELGEVIIKYFMNNAKSSQIFLVSHSTNLLSNTILRPDQLYAIDFYGANGSVARRFSDEKPREAQNIEKMYISGVFGGIPRYGEDDY